MILWLIVVLIVLSITRKYRNGFWNLSSSARKLFWNNIIVMENASIISLSLIQWLQDCIVKKSHDKILMTRENSVSPCFSSTSVSGSSGQLHDVITKDIFEDAVNDNSKDMLFEGSSNILMKMICYTLYLIIMYALLRHLLQYFLILGTASSTLLWMHIREPCQIHTCISKERFIVKTNLHRSYLRFTIASPL